MKEFIDEKSKKLFMFFFLLVLVAALFSALRYFLFEDYYVKAKVYCDSTTERCFVSECSEGDLGCIDYDGQKLIVYKWVKKKAHTFSYCNENTFNCPIECNKPDCEEILCDEETLSDGEYCMTNRVDNNGPRE